MKFYDKSKISFFDYKNQKKVKEYWKFTNGWHWIFPSSFLPFSLLTLRSAHSISISKGKPLSNITHAGHHKWLIWIHNSQFYESFRVLSSTLTARQGSEVNKRTVNKSEEGWIRTEHYLRRKLHKKEKKDQKMC